jgi:molybdenum cofactor guanylyltransferase
MKLSAVLLVGGESTRMGRDKATVFLDGQPLWKHQLQLLRSLAPAEILISGRVDSFWRPRDTRFIADAAPSQGPLSGLVAAVTNMNGTHLLALAVDMPFLTKANLEWIWGRAKSGRGVLPFVGSRAEPLAAIYPRESAAWLSAALEFGELSLQRVTKKLVDADLLSGTRVWTEDEDCYRSINNPADLARAMDALPAYPR